MSDLVLADDGRDPWEKQPNESRQAFANFVVYRDLGPRRSLAKASSESGKSKALMEQQSRKNKWVERTDAYDVEMDRRHREARETAIDQMYTQGDRLGEALMAAATTRLRGDDNRDVAALDLNALDPGDVKQFIVEGFRMRLLANRQPTDLVGGAFLIKPAEMTKIVSDILDVVMPEVPAPRHGYVLGAVQDVIEGRR